MKPAISKFLQIPSSKLIDGTPDREDDLPVNEISDIYSRTLFTHSAIPRFRHYYNMEFTSGFTMPSHRHKAIEIMLIRHGSCHITIGTKDYFLEQGDLVLINGEVSHQLHIRKTIPAAVLCLEMTFVVDHSFLDFGGIFENVRDYRLLVRDAPHVVRLSDETGVSEILLNIYRELKYRSNASDLLIQTCLCQFFVRLSGLYAQSQNNLDNPANRYVREVIDFIYSHYHQHLTMDQIADEVSLNVSYLHRIFKQIMGTTPSQYRKSETIQDKSTKANDHCVDYMDSSSSE